MDISLTMPGEELFRCYGVPKLSSMMLDWGLSAEMEMCRSQRPNMAGLSINYPKTPQSIGKAQPALSLKTSFYRPKAGCKFT